MKKYFFYALVIVLVSTTAANAQPSEMDPASASKSGVRAFKVYNNPAQDKIDQFEIHSVGGTTFTTSNIADGTTNSYKHSQQIIVSLVPNKAGNTTFQLNFYTPTENVQQAATYTENTLHIYYPVAMYEAIRTKLEQALAAKKKVIVKVIQKPNGFREGTLIL